MYDLDRLWGGWTSEGVFRYRVIHKFRQIALHSLRHHEREMRISRSGWVVIRKSSIKKARKHSAVRTVVL